MSQRRTLTGAIVCLATIGTTCHVAAGGIPGQGTWETTLLGRDIHGNPIDASDPRAVFFYDTLQDITWLRNANLLGPATREVAMVRAAKLSIGGFTGWRLPQMVDTGAPGCDYSFSGTDCGWNVQTAGNEMATLYYIELGNASDYDPNGVWRGEGFSNPGNFRNIQFYNYWYSTPYAPERQIGWVFLMSGGEIQTTGRLVNAPFSMYVRPGDIATDAQTVSQESR